MKIQGQFVNFNESNHIYDALLIKKIYYYLYVKNIL